MVAIYMMDGDPSNISFAFKTLMLAGSFPKSLDTSFQFVCPLSIEDASKQTIKIYRDSGHDDEYRIDIKPIGLILNKILFNII
jgi:hypothetical protein